MYVRPNHKAIKQYHAHLQQFEGQQVYHETAVRSAFQTLLADTARARKWMLVPELATRSRRGRIIPDGTLRDEFSLPRGFWEAKDTQDDLDAEIQTKIDKGYPTTNIIFEDTRHGVLYQDRSERLRVNLRDAKEVADLLNEFYSHSEPDIDEFEKAVDEFKERVPDLAKGLAERIREAHRKNAKFKKAFGDFFELCKASLNPNLSQDAVDEMLVQHLLTERLIRTIFDNPDFVRRNVIAAEIEKVIDALVSQDFNRAAFLRSLDRFYTAIEDAARDIQDYSDKQHFLNSVYERFFQGYSVKVADTHGIVYTPQAIVDFMCASVEHVLKEEFGLRLTSPEVVILDPCTGTGNFIVNLLNRMDKRNLADAYKNRLFANEVMLLPYYIAALNVEHAYYELSGSYEPFEGLCFVDSLDMAEHPQGEFGFMTKANTERVERQKRAPVTVIVGNPPYNVGQLNENDNNKNRRYPVVDKRIKDTYSADSSATLNSKLYDPFVRFFRWATDRLGDQDGVLCFVSNNSFLSKPAFDGMRKHLLQHFDTMYHIDLRGDVREDPHLPGTTYNVFGIKVGVGITLAVRRTVQQKAHVPNRLFLAQLQKSRRREEKLGWLAGKASIETLLSETKQPSECFDLLVPSNPAQWVTAQHYSQFLNLTPLGNVEAKRSGDSGAHCLFMSYCLGVSTNRDSHVYDFAKEALCEKVQAQIDAFNGEVDRLTRTKDVVNIDSFVDYSSIKWSSTLKRHLQSGTHVSFSGGVIQSSLYRPFSKQKLYYDRILVDRPSIWDRIFPVAEPFSKNIVVCVPTVGNRGQWSNLASNSIVNLNLLSLDAFQCFPFYVYDEDGTNRRDNITDWALKTFREHYKDRKIDKWAIFYYVYGLLHHPGYREKYADCLKRELPRIPFAPDFRAFSKAGKELAHWHLDYETVDEYDLEWVEHPSKPLSYRVEKMKLSKNKTELKVNNTLTLAGIPPETFEYRLGNRSALEWVIDQYQVKTDRRSGITSDPNREDDPEYIVRLVGQVITVSLKTVEIMNGLPKDFGG